MTWLGSLLMIIKNLFVKQESSNDFRCKGVQIVQEFESNSQYKMPVTIEDVKWYLNQMSEKDSEMLHNIESIVLTTREVFFTDDVFASYDPYGSKNKKAVIKLYPIQFNSENRQYVLTNSEGKQAFISEEEARQMQLFNLGHEIGHNVVFRQEGKLYGEEVEEKCDKFSEKFNFVLNANRLYAELF